MNTVNNTHRGAVKALMLIAAIMVILICMGTSNKAFAATYLYPRNMPDPVDSEAVGVRGDFLGNQKEALKRMNEIRLEACKEGVPDPRTDGKTKLKPSDYVPLKWSTDIEEYARLRAAEASVFPSHFQMGSYLEPDRIKDDYFEGKGEVLAFGCSTIKEGVEAWYKEKKDWVKLNDDWFKVGHYATMIDPDNRYVGMAGFQTFNNGNGGGELLGNSRYRSSICARFHEIGTFEGESNSEKMMPAQKDVVQIISLYKSALGKPYLAMIAGESDDEGEDGIYAMQTEDPVFGIARKVDVPADAFPASTALVLAADCLDYKFTSSNPSALPITADGKARAAQSGKAVVTATNSKGTKYTIKVKVWSRLDKPAIKKVKRSGKNLKVTFIAEDLGDGTQFQIAKDKNFKKVLKTVKFKNKAGDNMKYTRTIKKLGKKLSKKGNLYIRARAYGKFDGIKYYSHWSKAKKIK
ncbi:MAG: CAP domain-containing protein [Eubacterium sp.]|nr:CAP domain-containing protein [Eubacterium sp.]